ncbi:DUF2732 family protein [Xenorhabdus szentirmaii]|uniref:DUF2732 family protein n=1 Tax=Xenorhabdus szentirmaii TaxID=290112 RepID=UPI001985DF3D|nr:MULTISPECIES: DUF2732 family protein [unclassified Xenorhabdus]MBD2806433.1 DUF2732 family protein [Xenorhabdus sp. ZM]MBD2825661.1 DUF2732 family protein [Xenorhabdus sp. 5]
MNTEQLIKKNREDERKTLAVRSASRLGNLAANILANKLDYAASSALLVAEAEKYEHEAQELEHV